MPSRLTLALAAAGLSLLPSMAFADPYSGAAAGADVGYGVGDTIGAGVGNIVGGVTGAVGGVTGAVFGIFTSPPPPVVTPAAEPVVVHERVIRRGRHGRIIERQTIIERPPVVIERRPHPFYGLFD